MVLGKSNIKKTSDELDKYKADKVIEYLEKESSINEKKSTMSIQDYFKHKIGNLIYNIEHYYNLTDKLFSYEFIKKY